MPTFDVVSEVDLQEVRNAVDQASRELTTRFDFKGTDTSVEFEDKGTSIALESSSEDRLKAAVAVLEEKMVKRKVSLKALDYGKIEASQGSRASDGDTHDGHHRQKAKEIGKFIKGLSLKGVNHQVQGDQLRVIGQEARRPASSDRGRCASTTSASRCSSRTSATDACGRSPGCYICWSRAMRSSVGGCVVHKFLNCTCRPVSGLTM